jgi:hypothetical protein
MKIFGKLYFRQKLYNFPFNNFFFVLSKISIVILQNLLNYHDDHDMFNISSLKLLLDLIGTKDTIEPITKSKLMFLLHGTKLKLASERLCSWFVKVKLMKELIIDNTNDRLNRWRMLGFLILNHPVVSENGKFSHTLSGTVLEMIIDSQFIIHVSIANVNELPFSSVGILERFLNKSSCQ